MKKRRKNRPIRQAGTNRFVRFLLMSAGLFILGGTGVGTYRFVVLSPYFSIEEIEIVGLQRACDEEVRAVLGVNRGDNLLLTSPAMLRRRAEAHPWIRAAQVEKVYPDFLRVRVEERTPSALLVVERDERLYGLDPEGVVLPPLPSEDLKPGADGRKFVLPVVTGFGGPAAYPGATLESPDAEPVTELLRAFRDSGLLAEVLAEIRFDEKNGYTAIPVRRIDEIRLGKCGLRKRVAMLEQTWAFLERQNIYCEYVDLRFEAQGAVLSTKDLSEQEWNRLASETFEQSLRNAETETQPARERG